MNKLLIAAVAWGVVAQPWLLAAQGGPTSPSASQPVTGVMSAPPMTTHPRLDGPLRAAASRHDFGDNVRAGRLDRSRAVAAQEPNRRTWIGRHPALFGAIVGAGAGLVAAGTMDNELICGTGSDEDCLFYTKSRFAVGAGIGAGIGALVGWVVSLGRD